MRAIVVVLALCVGTMWIGETYFHEDAQAPERELVETIVPIDRHPDVNIHHSPIDLPNPTTVDSTFDELINDEIERRAEDLAEQLAEDGF